MKKFICVLLCVLMCAATVALVACDKKEETLKFGMGVLISASATDATADKDGEGKATINVAVITVDADGKVTGINILSHSETAGLGAKATENSFRDRFAGLIQGITVSKDKAGDNSIDAITGATITSNAVYCSIEAALNQFEKCGGVK